MDYGKAALPLTGAGIAVGGVIIDQVWLLAIAGGLIAGGALLLRLTYRRGKPLNAR
jgi:hypothetical protein